MLSQTPICPALDVIQEVNKITLKMWSNAFPIGNFYSYLQVLKATSRACPDFVMIWFISIRKRQEKDLKSISRCGKSNMQKCMLEKFGCLGFFFPQHIAVSASIEIDIANLVKQVKS